MEKSVSGNSASDIRTSEANDCADIFLITRPRWI